MPLEERVCVVGEACEDVALESESRQIRISEYAQNVPTREAEWHQLCRHDVGSSDGVRGSREASPQAS
jgi:hypothetical protein